MTKDFHPILLFLANPGHEIVGVMTQVGSNVKIFKIGDKAGVGCKIESCGSCNDCQNDLENYCPKSIDTYTIFDHGITVFSPMKFYGLDKAGMHVGVVGLGGLGHVAVKFAKAFGMKVTVISTTPSKKIEAIQQLKADSFLVSHDMNQMQAAVSTMDGRKMIGGSAIGGMKETQEMIEFAAKHNITASVEVISMDYVNKAMDRLAEGDVRYRFVIDIGNTLKPQLP
ncbi:hypothetical protein Patl1_11408 [Pistacia atlantica]|uniref:Uncharacterized protein n=1 Tax=Pistacia atlantica TaxID=434234 RepID=A0ACC1A7B9_9ROSI|nr:hypothetical protein Patl1_11408 [Pistacia atlantica]